jgi:signal transduction histidine kinase/DNA-binding LacI/PurR family transcriptional regulator/AraC-like DNA-binding protein
MSRVGRRDLAKAANGLPTVGLLLADMHTGASGPVWSGLCAEAASRGLNLVCFSAGRLHGLPARATILDLPGPECLDGLLIWSSSITGGLRAAQLEAFHGRFKGLPIVSLSQPCPEGASAVTLDSYQGMREVVSHLASVHGFRRIAFIRGPDAHPGAEDRLRAYLDALACFDIPRDDTLISPPMAWDQGAEAARILLDDRGIIPGRGMHALAAASDLLAFWALRTIQARGYRVPSDVAITGFNDTAESRLAAPALTTAAMPFREQGGKALDMIVQLLERPDEPRSCTLAARLVVRESCGCPSAAVALAAAGLPEPEPRGGPGPVARGDTREQCIAEMAGAAYLSPEAASAWLAPLYDCFMEDVGGRRPVRFPSLLDEALDRAMRAGHEMTPWQNAVSALRRRALSRLAGSEVRFVEDLLSQARVLIAEAAAREKTWRQWHAERTAQALRDTGMELLTSLDLGRVCDTLCDRLPRLGIGSFALALMEPGSADARLVLARTDRGRAKLPIGGLPYPARLLLPRAYLPRTRRYDLAVEPLQFGELWLGFLVMEIGPSDGSVYEALRDYLAGSLKGASLLRDQRNARAAAEKADLIKTRLLANVSHELRTPLDIIIRRAREARSGLPARPTPSGLAEDLEMIVGSAEHQLRVIEDLLDLSRAEIDELDLDLALLDPRPILEETFKGIARSSESALGVSWTLQLPERLPIIKADPVRLRQIVLNILANARDFTPSGSVVLRAEVEPPCLHVSVTDTGPGIAAELRDRIFEPFATAERADGRGIGLGLSIARHLASLHAGTLTVDSEPGAGSVFHLRLPLPDLADRHVHAYGDGEPFLAVVGGTAEPSVEIGEFCRRSGLAIRRLRAGEDWEAALGAARPAALAWDLADARPEDWPLVRKLRHHPRLFQAPVVLYAGGAEGRLGITGLVPKSAARGSLLEFIDAACPEGSAGPLLIVDDEQAERDSLEALVRARMAGVRIRQAADGEEALAAMAEERPRLVVLDLMLPRLDGFAVLDRMRASEGLRGVPVVVLTHKVLDQSDLRRIEAHARVILQSKGVWSDDEVLAALDRGLFGAESLPPHTGALAKRALAWLAANHAEPVARWQLAEAVGASEDYLCRVFRRELGLSPWEYLNRYRIHHAKELLRGGGQSLKEISALVGISDPAYFSRLFHRITGATPKAYRAAQ